MAAPAPQLRWERGLDLIAGIDWGSALDGLGSRAGLLALG